MLGKPGKFQSITFISILAVLALVLAACSPNTSAAQATGTTVATTIASTPIVGGSATMAATTASTTGTVMAPATPTGPVTVKSAQSTTLGTIVVDSNGMTLYYFMKDTPGVSNCSGNCATLWPPFLTNGTPTTSDMNVTGTLGVLTRSDGSQQVTYDGYPLYYYTGDKAAGDTNGQGLNNLWYVVPASGVPTPSSTSSSPAATATP